MIFFDTPDLKLNRGGLVVRARRIPQCGDAVIKLRPVVPTDLSKKLRRSEGFTIEVDLMPNALVCSGSLKVKVDNVDVKEVLAGLPADPQIVPARAAFLLQGARPGKCRSRLPHAVRTDHGREVEVLGTEVLETDGRGGVVVLSRRVAHPRTIDQVRTGRSVAGPGRSAGVPEGPRNQVDWRATNENPQGAGVLSRLHAGDQR